MPAPVNFEALAETPQQLASGRVRKIDLIEAHNPSETAGAYVKIYAGASAPTSSSIPLWAGWVPPGATGSGGHRELFVPGFDGALFWLTVATEFAAGLTAPDTPFNVSVTAIGP